MAEPGGPVPGVLIDLEIADSLVGLRDGRLHLQGAGSASIESAATASLQQLSSAAAEGACDFG